MQPGLVSIMMPAYNSEQFVGSAIESALKQSYTSWELIVVNDGSTDRTAEIAATYVDTRIQIFHKQNGGEGSARNHALGCMQGEFVAFLDADDEWLPHHLEVLVGYLQDHPLHNGVFTDGFHVDREGKQLQPLSSRRRGPFQGNVFPEVVRSSDVFGPPLCMLIRRKPILQHNLRFDTEIGYGTDWDFFTRYAETALFGYVKDLTCLYRVHDTNMTITQNQQKRRLYWARCREKAIKLTSFKNCSLDIRQWVFHDLLVNLLVGHPARQNATTEWPEFKDLPAGEQARIFRLMASKVILDKGPEPFVLQWLKQAESLNPSDLIGRVLYGIYRISPKACQLLLLAKQFKQAKTHDDPIFGDLNL